MAGMNAFVFRGARGWWAGMALAIAGGASLPAAEPAPGPIRVLIVTGQDYPSHHWRETTPVLRRQLEQDSRFVTRVAEDPRLLDSAAIRDYDVVLLHFMNWETPSPGPAARENLNRYVRNGGGLVLVHFACGAWQDWPGFVELAGRVWDPKLRPHDPRGPFTVTPTAVPHPITAGMKPFETDDELYTCLAGKTPITVLATARSKVDGKDYPMAFVLTPGKGRVFHTPLGHDVKALGNPAVGELLRRGTAWAAGR
jgi:type 1 glutamine amidotransferase